MVANIWILGGYQSDFARNFTREGLDFADLTREVVEATLADSLIDATDIDVVHVANAFGEMFARQGHLGRCRPPSTKDSGTLPRPGMRPPARPAVWLPWQRSPTCGQETTAQHWWSAWS